MDKELLDSLMKLHGISIEVEAIDDEDFKQSWTFIIKGLDPILSVAKMHASREKALESAEYVVYRVLTEENHHGLWM